MYYREKGKGGGEDKREDSFSLSKEEVNEILNLNENNVKFFIEKASECAEKFKKGKVKVNPNQIRNFYAYVKDIERELKRESDKEKFDIVKLHLLRPKIAYAVGRELVSPEFQKIFEDLINGIKERKHFENFAKFFEAIVAYYKEK